MEASGAPLVADGEQRASSFAAYTLILAGTGLAESIAGDGRYFLEQARASTQLGSSKHLTGAQPSRLSNVRASRPECPPRSGRRLRWRGPCRSREALGWDRGRERRPLRSDRHRGRCRRRPTRQPVPPVAARSCCALPLSPWAVPVASSHTARPSPNRSAPSGLGLHFPKLDADLYLPALLAGVLGSKAWAAAQLGQAGGQARTAAKQEAARRNGRLAGRPKQAAVPPEAGTGVEAAGQRQGDSVRRPARPAVAKQQRRA
jgi:hypothetical protein